MSFNIAIDGPAGAGKSTIARLVAGRLSFIYVDTGAMYRAFALYILRTLGEGAQSGQIIAACPDADIDIRYENGEQIVLLNGENVNPWLRTEEVTRVASVTSALPEVRAHLLSLQRELARRYDVVMDGRDIGTTILPQAQVKIFLTASAETRARRRTLELEQKGEACSYETILAQIRDRDERDSTRAASPLKQASDAVLVDSSDLSIDEVADRILQIVHDRMRAEQGEKLS